MNLLLSSPKLAALALRSLGLITKLVLPFTALAALAQSPVMLAWDPSITKGVTGYRVYHGTSSRSYSSMQSVGNLTQASISGLTNGTTYYFAVTAYDASGLESDFSTEVSATAGSSKPPPTLVFAADSGTITSPFAVSNGIVSQNLLTSLLGGGRAAYSFTVNEPAAYTVSALVNAPNGSANSFYVNIDTEPGDPQNIWDIPVTAGFTNRTVSWTTGGPPQLFNLAAGNHQLIIRGREGNTQLNTITISPAYARMQITTFPGNLILLSGLAQIGHRYDVLATTDFKTWTTIGSVTGDNSGSFSILDTGAQSLPMRAYRLRDLGP